MLINPMLNALLWIGIFLFLLPIDASMFRSTPAFAVRVVSYNVLSSHLASPSYYTTLDPAHLESSYRLPLVLKKLDEEISSSSCSVVVCLQELSYDWTGPLHVWFANKGYHLVTGHYGKKFNGYMGIAIAYPTEAFETLDVDISRLSDKRIGGWPVKPKPTLIESVLSNVKPFWSKPLEYLGLWKKPNEDHWSMSERRNNVLLTTTLKDKKSGKAFCVGNYHMPCAFFMPMTMTIHSELAAKHVQDIAASKDGLPYILAGDWNITPDSPTYKMLTTGALKSDDPSYPTPKYDMEWCVSSAPMRSAYAEKDGEPDFTNNARAREDDPFIDTLDYIFLSPEWKVESTKSIVHRNIANGPYPNAHEPSDHVLISAELTL
jgi:mRNA deadenylase 3'-5' endonuclease subunit Ccr4